MLKITYMTSQEVLPKAAVLRILEDMPDSVTFEELMDRIIYLFKVERGLRESEQGKGKTIEDIRKELKQWHKPA